MLIVTILRGVKKKKGIDSLSVTEAGEVVVVVVGFPSTTGMQLTSERCQVVLLEAEEPGEGGGRDRKSGCGAALDHLLAVTQAKSILKSLLDSNYLLYSFFYYYYCIMHKLESRVLKIENTAFKI